MSSVVSKNDLPKNPFAIIIIIMDTLLDNNYNNYYDYGANKQFTIMIYTHSRPFTFIVSLIIPPCTCTRGSYVNL